MITISEAAKALDQNEYCEEGSKELFAEMSKANLVAIFGASDDIMCTAGAIGDEHDLELLISTFGEHLVPECDDEDCPHEKRRKDQAHKVEAVFDSEGFTFVYKTTIPHETFIILEEGDNYCRGIVIDLNNLA